jgi:hypothetical protein
MGQFTFTQHERATVFEAVLKTETAVHADFLTEGFNTDRTFCGEL